MWKVFFPFVLLSLFMCTVLKRLRFAAQQRAVYRIMGCSYQGLLSRNVSGPLWKMWTDVARGDEVGSAGRVLVETQPEMLTCQLQSTDEPPCVYVCVFPPLPLLTLHILYGAHVQKGSYSHAV